MRPILLTALLALAGAAPVLAGTTAANPKALALRASDFPAGVKTSRISDNSGPGGKVYAAAYNVKVAGREEEVIDTVRVIPPDAKSPTPGLVAGPQSTYLGEVGQNTGFRGEKSLALSRFGDEQTANWADYKTSDGAERARAALVVRKGNVVWTLTVENCSSAPVTAFGCFFGPTPPKITQGQAVAELRKYARKQKARIGSG